MQIFIISKSRDIYKKNFYTETDQFYYDFINLYQRGCEILQRAEHFK